MSERPTDVRPGSLFVRHDDDRLFMMVIATLPCRMIACQFWELNNDRTWVGDHSVAWVGEAWTLLAHGLDDGTS